MGMRDLERRRFGAIEWLNVCPGFKARLGRGSSLWSLLDTTSLSPAADSVSRDVDPVGKSEGRRGLRQTYS